MTRAGNDDIGVERPSPPERYVSKPLTIAAALVAALAIGATGFAASLAQPQTSEARALGDMFFNRNMARSEVVLVKGGQVHDYRIDQGKVTSVRPGLIELLERDGTRQAIPVSPTAQVWVNGRVAAPIAIPLRANVITIRDGDEPASIIRLTGSLRP